jgi:ubiquinone/menaquinone biosynthesis C-methylase UbiE
MQKSLSPLEENYFRPNLFETILHQLNESGITRVSRKDLAGVDEFHVRGAAASVELAREAGINKNSLVLDVGCGIGGPSRMLAEEFGCKVTGIDITSEFIRTAGLLSELVGLQDATSFLQGDASQLPFEAASFDLVWTQHVQMNIENKHQFYSEIRRVLKPGGKFIYYDIFTKNGEPIYYPVPWAKEASASFLFTTTDLYEELSALGFTKEKISDQTKQGEDFFIGMMDKMAREGPPKIGLHLVMGNMSSERLINLLKSMQENKIEIQSGIYKCN